ncbi:unnamed protein product [Schistosoma margrebowiei]|uniref:Uncharacterized protein n=1 Tax=Schistosoma margrebowiei TaxID=48269 RepID=A0AA84ZZZ7_9TREM|nr:unnamed protein product [Schistosoma margrebowiei]
MTMKQGKSVFVSSKFRMLKRTHTMHVGYTGPMNEPSNLFVGFTVAMEINISSRLSDKLVNDLISISFL